MQFCEAIGSALFGALFVTTGNLSLLAVIALAAIITPLQQRCHTVSINAYEEAEILTLQAKPPTPLSLNNSSQDTTSDRQITSTVTTPVQPVAVADDEELDLPLAGALAFCLSIQSPLLRSLFSMPVLAVRNTAAAARTLHGLAALPASMSFTVCFFNVALGPGAIMTAFLAQQVVSSICTFYFSQIRGRVFTDSVENVFLTDRKSVV